MELSAVILAGGESRRMGRDKAWVTYDGKPLLQLAVDKVRAVGVREIFISGRPGEDYSAFGCSVLLDREAGFGPLGGIERGLDACTSPLLLVLAVDMPRMTSELLRKLASRCDRLTGVVLMLPNGLEPLAAIYPRRCHALAFDALARSQRAARVFAEACLRERAVKTFTVPRSEAAAFLNCNQPGDLAAAGSTVRNGVHHALVPAH